jgi:hypothetical protein
MNEVMEITSELHGQHGVDIQLADWNKLAGLPRMRSVHDVRELFYPGLEPDVDPYSSGARRRDFFPNADNGAYLNLYRSVLSELGRQFIDIQALLKTTKQEGKLMSMVMSHVSHWMNAEPEKVSERDNNKPALRKDLVAALRVRCGDKADDESRALQQAVLHHVREKAKDFTSTALEHYLHEYPSGDDEAYGARFKQEVWRKVLSIVTIFAGPTLQHKYLASPIAEESRKISPLTIAQTARDLICEIPAVANDPALRSTTAAQQLLGMMQPVIARWISEQRMDVPDHHSEDGHPSAVPPADERLSQASRSHTSIPEQASAAARQRMVQPWTPERSATHGSFKEPTSAQLPKCGLTVASAAEISPQIEVQDRGLIDFSLTGLNNLRKQHRHKSAAATGSGHWRQRASARRGK